LFAVQSEITGRIAATLQLELVGAEVARPIERPDAMDYILRGRAASYKSPTRENYAEAVGWLERALSLDQASVEAKSLLASILAARALDRMTDTSKKDFARAEALVREVLAVSPRSPIAHYAFGQVLRATRRNEQCIPEYQEALAFNRSWADALAGLGWCKFWVGSLEEAITLHEQALRLSPRDPQIGYRYHRVGQVHLLQSRIQEAIPWLEKGRSTIPTFPLAYSFLGAAYALNGETERGIKELAETYRLSGKVWVSTIADMKVTGYWRPPKIRALYESVYFAGLRKLGVPRNNRVQTRRPMSASSRDKPGSKTLTVPKGCRDLPKKLVLGLGPAGWCRSGLPNIRRGRRSSALPIRRPTADRSTTIGPL
jgi:tetratricopeptide (TPR) repeat protein